MNIRAAVTYKAGDPFVIQNVELEAPRENDILVKISACGLCHTDAAARDGVLPVPLPAVLGHEGAGIVESVGTGVVGVKPGDHVVLTQNSCGVCACCVSGHPMSCEHVPDFNFMGVYPDGAARLTDEKGARLGAFFSQSSFATYAISDVHNTIVIDKSFDLALAAPLGCGIQTGAGAVLNVLSPAAGESIAIFGCGGVGLAAIMAAKVSGCAEIFAIDTLPERLRLAGELGATHMINARETPDIAGAIREMADGRGVDYSLECAGVAALVNPVLDCLKRRGTAGLVGSLGDQEVVSKPMETLIKPSRKLIGILEGDSIPQLFIPRLIKLYQKGLFPYDRLIRFYDFEQINEAFEDAKNGVAIKPVLRLP